MKTLLSGLVTMLFGGGLACSGGDFILASWSCKLDGVTTLLTRNGTAPSAVNLDQFDPVRGLGTLRIRTGTPGAHYIGAFLDLDIEEASNTFFNELGLAVGTPAPGQSWEIGELGYRSGTLYRNLLSSKLANAITIPGSEPDDVALGMAWSFTNAPGQIAVVHMAVQEVPPPVGFYLAQTDPISNRTLYFWSHLDQGSGESENPVIVCPENLTVEAEPGSCSRDVTYTVSATDNEPGVTVVCNPPSGSSFPVGITTVQCVATDAVGNRSTCDFDVTVRPGPPVIQCPANIIVECAPAGGQRVDFEVTATGSCGTEVTVTCDPPSGTVFPLGATEVKCRAVDATGGVSECSFAVFLVGTECDGEFGLMKSTCLAGEAHADPLMHPYPCGTCVQLTAVPADGWVFMGWLGDARGTEESITITMSQRKCVEAVFGTRITVAPSIHGVGWLDPKTELYPCASTVRLLAKPDPGFSFSHWTNSVTDRVSPVEFNVERTNATVMAVFEPLPVGELALTVETVGSGRVQGQPSRRLNHYPAQTNVTLLAVPDFGQQFKGWSFDSALHPGASLLTNNPLKHLMDTNKYLVAHFTRTPSLEIVRCQGTLDKDLFQFKAHGRLLDTIVIETSTALGTTNTWKEVTREVNFLGAVEYEEPYLANVRQRYYRAKALEDAVTSSPEPRVSIVRSGENVEISWPNSASNYILESASNMHAPLEWEPVPTDPIVTPDRMLLRTTPDRTARFYRLRSAP